MVKIDIGNIFVQKCKILSETENPVRINRFVAFLFIILFRVSSLQAQTIPIDTTEILRQLPLLADSLGIPDSVITNPEYRDLVVDSLLHVFRPATTMPDSVGLADTTRTSKQMPPAKGDVETTVDYKARDSIYFDLKNQKMYLYGESKIDYGNISLQGERIELDWVNNTIQANYVIDTAGKKIGKPVFSEAGQTYVTDDMTYNFKSRKAIINGIITEQDGAIMHGEKVKKNERDEMFIRHAKYTTCDHAEPHFYIKSKKLKVIPNNKVVSGPFNIYFGEIPTPLGFPMGMFPSPKEKASGIIFPRYGEDAQRGFFLRNGGYYFDISDKMDLKLTGDIFTNGSYALQANSTYKVRYKYSGRLSLTYAHTVDPAFESEDFTKDYAINWSHSPQSFGNSRFSASVNARTQTFSQNTNDVGSDFNRAISAQLNSNITYSTRFRGTPFNLSMSARHSQNLGTGIMNLTLPQATLSANRINPFKNMSNKASILKNLGFSYNVDLKNDLTNGPKRNQSFNVVNRSSLDDSVVSVTSENLGILWDRAQIGARHQVPITTSFSLLKYLTVSPSFNYTEVWYPRELRYTYVPAEEGVNEAGVRVDTLRQFSRAGWYSTGASMSTRFYGQLNFKGEKIKAIRHVITPSIGFSYSPDYSDPSKGVYQEVQINEDGDTRLLSKYDGFIYGSPPLGEAMSMSFAMNHNLEMKVRDKKDSTKAYKKVKIFENLSMSSSYNFLADSFNLSNINWNARTSLFNRSLSINLSGSIDPYVYVLDSISESGTVHQTRIDRFAWNYGRGLGQINRATVALGLNLRPKSAKRNEDSGRGQSSGAVGGQIDNNFDPDNPFVPQDGQQPMAGSVDQVMYTDPNQYVPFDMPWSFNANYSLGYTKTGHETSRITQTLSFNGNLSLTQKTQLGFNSGFDLERKEFTVTRLNVARQLHCWVINFNWVPFGPRQSYFVEIRVLSHLLKDLRLDKKNRSSSFR